MASSSCPYEEDSSSSGGEPSIDKPPIQEPARQESDDSEEEKECESDEGPPEPRTQPKRKSSSLEMSVFRLRIKKEDGTGWDDPSNKVVWFRVRGWDMTIPVRSPVVPPNWRDERGRQMTSLSWLSLAVPQPNAPYNGRAYTCHLCVRRQIYCRECIRYHHCRAADTYSICNLLNHIIAEMKFKCDCNEYIPYCEFVEHRRECPSAKRSTPPARWKCMLKASLIQCSECEVPIRPPVFFTLWSTNLICSACYRADSGTYRHCTEIEYLLRVTKVKCIACKQYFPFSWLGSPRVGDCCPFKRELQNIAPGSSAPKKFCDEEETKRPMAENNSIHEARSRGTRRSNWRSTWSCTKKVKNRYRWRRIMKMSSERSRPSSPSQLCWWRISSPYGKNKRKVHFGVGKMDKHIFQGDEVASDDDSYVASYDDNLSETGKRVAETALDTSAYNKRAKTATPSGQKTGHV